MRRRLLGLLPAGLIPAWPAAAFAQAGMTASSASRSIEPGADAAPRITPRPLVFPDDFGAHPEHRTEWWYMTGWLQPAGSTGANAAFGFQVTFFRSRTFIAPSESRFAPTQLLFAHAALTDIAHGSLRHDQRAARAGFGIEAAQGDTRIAMRDWRLERQALPGGSRYLAEIASDAEGFSLSLQADTTQPVLLQGQAGYSRKGAGLDQASHYYSEPQLAVTGRLVIDGRAAAVQGRAWLDHEWSDALLADGAVGWDWIGMNLDDGSALTAFRLRRADGSASYAGGSYRPAGGEVRDFKPEEVLFRPGRLWKSPASGASYPVEWIVETPAGHFAVHALLDAQEQDSRASTGSFYWEGLSELYRLGAPAEPAHDRERDADRNPERSRDRAAQPGARHDAPRTRVGRGYLEMTGYSQRMTL